LQGVRPIPLSIVGVLLTALHSYPASAEIHLEGPIEDVRLEASDATVEEILTALGTRFHLHHRGTALNRPVTATYKGPLRRVLARVLEGYDYIIGSNGADIDVLVLGAGLPREASPAMIIRRRAD